MNVNEFLKQKTYDSILSRFTAFSYILKRNEKMNNKPLKDYTILKQGPVLNEKQAMELRNILLNPDSYYTGSPIYRRLPPCPEFAFLLETEVEEVEILIDLHNLGWEFRCSDEIYRDFTHANDLKELVKSLFPGGASMHEKNIWKKGFIKSLGYHASQL